jgi:uncharacterized repeat protein (TIGR01451 family)
MKPRALTLLLIVAVSVALTLSSPPTIGAVSLFQATATITGNVFRDYNYDGVREQQIGVYTEPPIPGITVTAYDATGTAVATATTDANGNYTLTVTAGVPLRIEFTGQPSYLREGTFGFGSDPTGSRTSVTFVTAPPGGLTDVNAAFVNPTDFCGADPTQAQIVTACYRGGASAGNTGPALVRFPYNFATPDTTIVGFDQVGATFGLAYQRTTNTLFASAYLKRHSDFGPSGPGAIYSYNLTTNTLTTLATIPNVGTNLHDTINFNVDAPALPNVGKASLGGMALDDNTGNLYVVNLFDSQLYRVTTSAPITVTAVGVIPNPCGAGLTAHPFGLGINDGRLYVGGVCDPGLPAGWPAGGNSNAGGSNNFAYTYPGSAYVYSYDLAAGTFSGAPVLQFNLDQTSYPRNCAMTFGGCNPLPPAGTSTSLPFGDGFTAAWRPWIDSWSWSPASTGYPVHNVNGDEGAVWASAMLTQITFDNGQMILGLRDRFGDQVGQNAPDANNQGNFRGVAAGDTLRACTTNGVTWTLETNGSCGGVTTAGTGNNRGPGGGEFYFDQFIVSTPIRHFHMSLGGVVQVPGLSDVVATLFDPTDNFNTGGVRRFSNAFGNRTNALQIYADVAGNFAKANGLAALTAICPPPPIEIGNFVWRDTNGNGVQDAGEAGIPGVTVELWRNGVQVGTTTTGPNGEYYFTNANVNMNGATGIVPNTGTTGGNSEYEIRIPLAQAPLNSLSPTAAFQNPGTLPTPDIRDSNGQVAGGGAYVNYVVPFADLSGLGANNHTYDFGFLESYSLGNRVWRDVDNSGTINAADGANPGIAGVTVNLYASNGTTLIATTTTDANGYYRFDNLPGGDYIVEVVTPAGFVSSTDIASSGNPNNDQDSDDNGVNVSATTVRSNIITLGPTGGTEPTGETDLSATGQGAPDDHANMTVDFGFFPIVLPTPTPGPGSGPGAGGGPGAPNPVNFDPVMTKLVEPSLVLPGEKVTYRITITNQGTAGGQINHVADAVPGVLTIVSVSTSQGSSQVNGNTVTWHVGTLNPGQSATMTIVAQVRPGIQPPVDVTNDAVFDDHKASATFRVTKGELPGTGEHPDEPPPSR